MPQGRPSTQGLDKLSLSKQSWLSKHAPMPLLNFDKSMMEEATKLFRYIDTE